MKQGVEDVVDGAGEDVFGGRLLTKEKGRISRNSVIWKCWLKKCRGVVEEARYLLVNGLVIIANWNLQRARP